MSSQKLKKIVSRIHDLPSLPLVADKMLKATGDSRTAATDLAQIITKDHSLTAKVLKLVNSAFYGFSQKISTISHAVVILGFHTIKNLAMSISIFESLDKDGGSQLFNRQEFWKHSLACGVFSRKIATKIGCDVPEEALTAGLLHDIGILIFDVYANEDFNKVITLMQEENSSLIDAESEILRLNHHIMGEWLATEWKLPLQLKQVIRYHHNPLIVPRSVEKKVLQLITITHISHLFCPYISICSQSKTDCLAPEIYSIVNTKEETIQSLTSEIEKEMEQAMASFGISGDA